MSSEHERGAGDTRHVDLVLGQLWGVEREELTREVAQTPSRALDIGELRVLFARLQDVTTQPTGRVSLAVRYAVGRRAELRGQRRSPARLTDWRHSLSVTARVLAVAAVVVLMLCYGRLLQRPAGSAADVVVARVEFDVAPQPAPIVRIEEPLDFDALLARGGSDLVVLAHNLQGLRQVADGGVFGSLVAADNDLAMLRSEFVQRFSPQERRRAIAAGGGRPGLDDRIQDLADDVAGAIAADLEAGQASAVATAMAMRALMAAGSTPRIGPHRDTVQRCVTQLKSIVGQLDGGDLATVLAALTDLAVVTHGQAAALVGEHGERLACATLSPDEARAPHGRDRAGGAWRRPPLLRFDTPVAALAEAGYVLRLAPAFGVHPALAHRARLLVAAHIEERLRDGGAHPEVLAAQLYGFGDLIDRREADRKLVLWYPRLFLPNYTALHHLAWSQFPLRQGWGRFQTELQGLAAWKTPTNVADSAALLLCLAMNFAAPGAHELLELAR